MTDPERTGTRFRTIAPRPVTPRGFFSSSTRCYTPGTNPLSARRVSRVSCLDGGGLNPRHLHVPSLVAAFVTLDRIAQSRRLALLVPVLLVSLASARPLPAQGADQAHLAALDSAYAAKARGDTVRAVDQFRRALALDTSSVTARLELAYIDLAAGRREPAVRWLSEALPRAPERADVRRQLGYTLADLGRHREAIAAFEGLPAAGHPLTQRDHLALGYLHAAVGDRRASALAFGSAATGADSTVQREALRVLAGGERRGAHTFAEWYVAPFYQTRFENAVGFGFLRVGLEGGRSWSPTAYLSLRTTRDSRSVGGRQPQIFTDNAAVPAVGVRTRPWGGPLWLYAEAGGARSLIADADTAWRRDLRGGAYLTWQREHRAGNADQVQWLTDVAVDVSWYERFDRNVIGYVQLREGVRLKSRGSDGATRRTPAVDVFGRGWVGYDGNGDFFNRAAEAGGGLALHLVPGVSAYAEGIAGRFIDRPPVGIARRYEDWRFTMVFGGNRTLGWVGTPR